MSESQNREFDALKKFIIVTNICKSAAELQTTLEEVAEKSATMSDEQLKNVTNVFNQFNLMLKDILKEGKTK